MRRKRKLNDIVKTKIVYFDMLPYDVVLILVRHTSLHPHGEDWQDYVQLQNLYRLLKCGGMLELVVRDVVAHMNDIEFNSFDKSCEVFEEFAPLLLNVGYRDYGGNQVPRALPYLPKLRVLRVTTYRFRRFPYDGTLRACGSSLEVLSLDVRSFVGSEEIEPIIRECSQLKELSIIAYSFKECDLMELWPAIGNTLTILHLKTLHVAFCDCLDLVENIATHCTVLQDICFNHPRVSWLYKRLGSQLRDIRMQHNEHIPCPIDIRDIFQYCPKARITTLAMCSNLAEQTFNALAPRLYTLCTRLSFHDRFPNLPILHFATLYLSNHNNVGFDAFFKFSRPSLGKLWLHDVESGVIFDKIAKSVKCLEELRISITNFDEPGAFCNDDLNDILLSNCGLQSLRIDFPTIGHNVKINRFISAILGIVRGCENLRDFDVRAREFLIIHKQTADIRTACVPLRNRGIAFSFCGIKYLPYLQIC